MLNMKQKQLRKANRHADGAKHDYIISTNIGPPHSRLELVTSEIYSENIYFMQKRKIGKEA